MYDPIGYELIAISIATGTFVKCYASKSFPSFKTSLNLSFCWTLHAHMLKGLFETYLHPSTCKFCLFTGYVTIEHVWDLVSWRFTRDPRPASSKDELLLGIQAIWNSLPQAYIQNLFDSMPRRIAASIARRGHYTKD
ncbi:uncharacterized protein TNCV_2521621 [Trichonephila clavipes]|nr:uncharacterized protein TNCV_2521621 [Trichonephila clavipes]